MQNSDDNLPKMDRWHSTLLDVHKWSDHPELKSLSERLYIDVGIDELDMSGNRKPKRKAKDMLRVLLLDLYVKWLHDPSLSIGFPKDKMIYKVKDNRYNKVFISEKIIAVEAKLVNAGFLDELVGYNDRTGQGDSFTTRIRPSVKLRQEFQQITADLYDIDFDVAREVIILREKFEDDQGKVRRVNRDYIDNEYSYRIREQLDAYNALLRTTFIDVPSLTEPVVRRQIEKGDRAGQKQLISVGLDNKHVYRVFNGTAADNWTKGGRFYGGWWLQIPRDMRKDIYINDQPTVEVDYKALHPNLLLLEGEAESSVYDPYDLGELVLPDIIVTKPQQRGAVKSLILMAINATSAKKAFQAFRRDKKKNDPLKTLKDHQLQTLLDAFTDKFPELKGALNTGKALELMNKDSIIANMVIDYFTQQGVPVLCIHDSFIIQHDKEEELKKVLHVASVQVAGKGIEQDTKSNKREFKGMIQGNVTGYEIKKRVTVNLPNKVTPTEQYKARRLKHYKWLESSKSN